MSRGRRTITKDQDHLWHILLIAGFFGAVIGAQLQSVVDKPLLIFSVGLLYVIINSVIDSRANLFSIDQTLLYATIATFAGFIVLSL